MNGAAKEYADALFELAAEKHRETECLNDLKLVLAEFEKFPKYPELLASPNISQAQKVDMLVGSFGAAVSPDCLNFLKVLCKNGRISLLPDCEKEYEAAYRKLKNTIKVRAVCAAEPSAAEKAELERKLKNRYGKETEIMYETDKSLLGGMVIYAGDEIIDGSLAGKINKAREELRK